MPPKPVPEVHIVPSNGSPYIADMNALNHGERSRNTNDPQQVHRGAVHQQSRQFAIHAIPPPSIGYSPHFQQMIDIETGNHAHFDREYRRYYEPILEQAQKVYETRIEELNRENQQLKEFVDRHALHFNELWEARMRWREGQSHLEMSEQRYETKLVRRELEDERYQNEWLLFGLRATESECDSSRTEVAYLRSQLAYKSMKCEDLTHSNRELERRIDSLRGQFSKAEGANKAFQQKLDDSNGAWTAAKKAGEQLETELAALKDAGHKQNVETKRLRVQVAQLQSEYGTCKTKLDEKLRKNVSLQSDLKYEKGKYMKEHEYVEKLVSEKKILEAQKSTAERKTNAMRRNFKLLLCVIERVVESKKNENWEHLVAARFFVRLAARSAQKLKLNRELAEGAAMVLLGGNKGKGAASVQFARQASGPTKDADGETSKTTPSGSCGTALSGRDGNGMIHNTQHAGQITTPAPSGHQPTTKMLPNEHASTVHSEPTASKDDGVDHQQQSISILLPSGAPSKIPPPTVPMATQDERGRAAGPIFIPKKRNSRKRKRSREAWARRNEREYGFHGGFRYADTYP